jgi:ABC-2 type transport system ATP-binding protein
VDGVTAAHAIRAEGIVKRFGDNVALDGLDLQVAEGSLYAMLGPNGAGKTTAVRIFTTLLKPDAGSASVAGYDVVRDANRLKSSIGLAGQDAAIDERLTGRENLVMIGQLYHLSGRDARQRAVELLEQFDLSRAADRVAKTYSGGMRRRLDSIPAAAARRGTSSRRWPTRVPRSCSRPSTWRRPTSSLTASPSSTRGA